MALRNALFTHKRTRPLYTTMWKVDITYQARARRLRKAKTSWIQGEGNNKKELTRCGAWKREVFESEQHSDCEVDLSAFRAEDTLFSQQGSEFLASTRHEQSVKMVAEMQETFGNLENFEDYSHHKSYDSTELARGLCGNESRSTKRRIMMNCAEKRKKLKAKPKVKNAEDKRKRKERVLRKIQRVSDELVVLRERYENRIVSLFDFAIETAQ
jgi:hypothetical protein